MFVRHIRDHSELNICLFILSDDVLALPFCVLA